jgi:outer membrane protein assembly factor BamB
MKSLLGPGFARILLLVMAFFVPVIRAQANGWSEPRKLWRADLPPMTRLSSIALAQDGRTYIGTLDGDILRIEADGKQKNDGPWLHVGGTVQDVAVGPRGAVYAADVSARTVRVFNASSAEIKSPATPEDFIQGPRQIAVTPAGTVFAGEYLGGSLRLLNLTNGESWNLADIATETGGIYDLAVGPHGVLFVLNGQLSQGSAIYAFGESGTLISRLVTTDPTYNALAVDGDGRFYLTREGGFDVFSPEGALLYAFYDPGLSAGGLPVGITLGTDGEVLLGVNNGGSKYVLAVQFAEATKPGQTDNDDVTPSPTTEAAQGGAVLFEPLVIDIQPGQLPQVEFWVEEGEAINISAEPALGSSADPVMEIYDPGNRLIFAGDNAEDVRENGAYLRAFPVPEAGFYSVKVHVYGNAGGAVVIAAWTNAQNRPSTALPGDGARPASEYEVAPEEAFGVTLQATFSQQANIRSGPGTNFPALGSGTAGAAVTLIGRNPAGDWVAFFNEDGSIKMWAAAFLMQIDGDVMSLTVLEP